MLFAFQVTDFYTGFSKDDPDLVQWEANIITSVDGLPENEKITPVGVHKCTTQDWDKFYDPTFKSKNLKEKMKTNNSAWCFNTKNENDESIDLSVYGAGETEPHRRLDLSFIPCKPSIRGADTLNKNCLIDDGSSESYL